MLDIKFIGFGLWSGGSTAWACGVARGAPGMANSCTLNWMVSTIRGIRKSMSGSVGAGGVTVGTIAGLKILDKVDKPADRYLIFKFTL